MDSTSEIDEMVKKIWNKILVFLRIRKPFYRAIVVDESFPLTRQQADLELLKFQAEFLKKSKKKFEEFEKNNTLNN